ncbi:MAG TPA: hypothetical protein VFJ70_05705 [Burkholderiales bacterium]|nr:hypothetical protein [Burkholderiales bacterium]
MRDSALRNSDLARPAPAEADFFGDYSPAVTFAAGVILVLAIGVIDKLTGYDLHLSVLYLLPIIMVTWGAGLWWALALSLATAALWLGIFSGADHYSTSFYFYGEGAVLFITFAVVVLLTAKLREALRAHELSFAMLEKLDAPAYVVDLQRDEVLLGNRQFRAAFQERSAAELARYPAHEARFILADGRPALLRILSV